MFLGAQEFRFRVFSGGNLRIVLGCCRASSCAEQQVELHGFSLEDVISSWMFDDEGWY